MRSTLAQFHPGVKGTIKVFPLAVHLDVGLIHAPTHTHWALGDFQGSCRVNRSRCLFYFSYIFHSLRPSFFLVFKIQKESRINSAIPPLILLNKPFIRIFTHLVNPGSPIFYPPTLSGILELLPTVNGSVALSEFPQIDPLPVASHPVASHPCP